MTKRCVIVGASHAGSQAAVSIRQKGWDGEIVLIGDEAELPYHRPPLSKTYLSGEKTLDQILLRPQAVYDKADITLALGRSVVSIDRNRRSVHLADGDEISYTKLVLSTGARVRKLNILGADDPRVLYLRNAADVRTIMRHVREGSRCVVIGGGYIGLEAAASLRKQGAEVTVLEAMERILQRVTVPEMSDFFRRVHTEEGASIIEGVTATSIEGASDEGLHVVTDDGQRHGADYVIVGIGVIPNTELAEAAGLRVRDGIEVDAHCLTTDPDIYAAGDCTWHHCRSYDVNLRLESVPNATEQAKIVGAHINGHTQPYDSLPWFWSDQYDVKLQIAGLSDGADHTILRGDHRNGRQFALFSFRGERLMAVDAVNDGAAFMLTKKALTTGQGVDKNALANPDCPLKEAFTDG